jgi:hypothetical protein
MSAIIDTTGLAHLVAVIERCRHDWDTPGIRHFVAVALTRHPYGHVARIAVGSALDPSARTPAVIPNRCDMGWTGLEFAEPPTPTPARVGELRCGKCGNAKTEPNHGEHCGRPAEPGARQRAYAATEGVPDELIPYVDEQMFKEVG